MNNKHTRAVRWSFFLLLALLLTQLPPLPSALPVDGSLLLTVEEQQSDSPPLVALTFDDGPRASTTGRLLDGLALREVQATFFLVGTQIEGNEDIVHRMDQEGHQIAVHSYDHIRIADLSRKDFDTQVGKTRAQLTKILGEGEFWLRPPYGILDDSVKRWAGCPIILWSVDPEDWKDKDVQRIVGAILSHTEDGSIILMHDIYESSVDAALQVVDALLSQGYCFTTVEQLMAAKGYSAQPGTVYEQIK